VNNEYDAGEIITQVVVLLGESDTVGEIENKVKSAERILYPVAIAQIARGLRRSAISSQTMHRDGNL
jgi:folate-dependent phosphoribosylglycinamide formyltransferase PurN